MFAIIQTGGKQYKVAPGDRILVEKLIGDAGDTHAFHDVLMATGEDGAVHTGTPTLAGARVDATIVAHDRDRKVLFLHKQRRKNSRRGGGHRQHRTCLTITGITLGET